LNLNLKKHSGASDEMMEGLKWQWIIVSSTG